MADADEVKAALEEALAGDDDVVTQTTDEQNPEVAEALKSALGSDDESASDDDADKSTEDEGKGAKTVPYDRLSKVVRQKNEVTERFNALDEQFKAATSRETELRTKIGSLEEDSQILDAIKNLAKDPRYKDHVGVIDRALQGIEEEVEEAEEQGDNKGLLQAEKRFEAKTAELEDLLADQRADSLWNETAAAAKSMLAALPDGYTDEDRTIIGQLWTPRVDWDGIEEAGSGGIASALNTSFADVIKEYGTPRGALVAKTTAEIESRNPELKIVSPEDKINNLMSTNWAELDKDGGAVKSDDDFNAGLAQLMRETNAGQ